MEKAQPIVTIPCSFGWDDVGSWPALEQRLLADEHGNVIEAARCIAVDSRNCIVGQDGNRGHGCGHGCGYGHGGAQTPALPGGSQTGSQSGSQTKVQTGCQTGLKESTRPTKPAGEPGSMPSRLIALLGVEDLIVVDTDNVLLVASMSRAQDLRKLPERLRAEGLEEYL